MKNLRTVRTAFRALARNPLRAALTMLGIFIGVGSVIAMLGIGNGSAAAIQRTVAKMGANILLIFPGATSNAGVNLGLSSAMTLTPDDAEAVLKCPAIRAGAPVVRIGRAQVLYGNKNWIPLTSMGSTSGYLDVREWSLDEGAVFTDGDVRNSGKVCLVGKTLVRELFNGQSPVGKELRVQNVSFKVIGVLSAKGSNMMGQDQDDILLAPWTTFKYRVSGINGGGSAASDTSGSSSVKKINQVYPNTALTLYPAHSDMQAADTPQPVKFANVDMIIVAARSTRDINPAIAQITATLRQTHRIREGRPEDFKVRDMTEMTNTMTKMTDTMTLLLLCVASISLVVGGVGIMNIMLVSVTERTREIGLRMAVGARPRDILRQFLIEALVLCLTGGALGITAGLLGSWAVQELKGWPTETSLASIILAVTVSGTVGVVFGFYPAWKASRLDPIDALRFD
ncbi:MAG TPA: ABC transporter permease [Planctomycetota bacterium]|jgi:ABC-type antimicrobial peptide transport system permease subunit